MHRTRQRIKWERNRHNKVDCPSPACSRKNQQGFKDTSSLLGHMKAFHPGLAEEIRKRQALAPHTRNQDVPPPHVEVEADATDTPPPGLRKKVTRLDRTHGTGRIAATPVPPMNGADQANATHNALRVEKAIAGAVAMLKASELQGMTRDELYRSVDIFKTATADSR